MLGCYLSPFIMIAPHITGTIIYGDGSKPIPLPFWGNQHPAPSSYAIRVPSRCQGCDSVPYMALSWNRVAPMAQFQGIIIIFAIKNCYIYGILWVSPTCSHMEVSWHGGTPNHPFVHRMFHEINHPAIGYRSTTYTSTSIYGNLHIKLG